ncbi:sensor histidine kinase [Ancylobacter sp. VNQ12]|uniref:sensor histidine kinase n=1 Tax=Ancylobacter sp. VNQ12 TaxID=3400920 RepID=UPI003C08FF27
MSTTVEPWSLKRRLAIRLLVVLTLGVLGPSTVMVIAAMWAIDSMDDRALQDQAADIVRNLDLSVAPPVLRLPERLVTAYETSGNSYLYAVVDAAEKIVASSSPAAAALAAEAMQGPAGTFFLVPRPDGGSPWYAYSSQAGPYRIAVAQGSLHEDAMTDSVIRDLLNFSLLTALPLLAVTVLVAIWTLSRAFRDIDRVAADARSITPGGADARLSSSGLPNEIRPLVEAVNDALARLSRAYDVERRFTTDAAHELRTPVAVLMARIDTMPPGALRDDLTADAARLSRLVSQMLDVARLDAAPLPVDTTVNLTSVVREAVAQLGPLALRDKRQMEMRAPERPVSVRGNEAALRLAVTNLVENAMLHTPAGTPIDIEVTDMPSIRVLDRGPGVPAAERGAVFERFQRSPTTTASGTGLGLAIVAEIAARHGAAATVEDREGGGSAFAIRWPRDG